METTTTTNFDPTREQLDEIRDISNLGISEFAIATLFDTDVEKLLHCCGELADANKRTANLLVYETLRTMASSGRNLAATLAWIKTHCPRLLPIPFETKSEGYANPNQSFKLNVYNNDGEPNYDY